MRAVAGLAALCLAAGCPSEQTFDVREQTDTWYQAPNNQVDILWVVDNSCSMTEEQDTLARGFASFTGEMEASGTDFHIGVISTSFDYADPTRGVLVGDPPFLTNDDDYDKEFQIRAKMGIEGSDKEKGLEAAAWALSPTLTTGPNAGFLRADAQLLIVIVSDEEDCSDEGALEGQPPEACYYESDKLVPVTEFVETFRELKETPDMVQIGAIVGVPNDPCGKATFTSKRYASAAALTGGLLGDICQSDWSGILSDLGLTASGVRSSFQLSRGAVAETIELTVLEDDEEQVMTSGWSYDPATWYITFEPHAVPARGAEITAHYTVDPSNTAPVTSTEPTSSTPPE